jgi:hypothetical protein
LEVFTAGFANPEVFPMIAHTMQASSAARNTYRQLIRMIVTSKAQSLKSKNNGQVAERG